MTRSCLENTQQWTKCPWFESFDPINLTISNHISTPFTRIGYSKHFVFWYILVKLFYENAVIAPHIRTFISSTHSYFSHKMVPRYINFVRLTN